MGRHDEAIEIATRAVALDPVSPLLYNELAFALFYAGRNGDALDQFQISLQLDPDYPQTHALLAEFYAATGEHDKALQHLEKFAEDLESLDTPVLGYLGALYADIGRTDDAQEILTLLRKRKETEYVPAMAFAYLYAGLEEFDEAIPWFEAAYEERDLSLVWYRDGSGFPEEIRNDPRIQAILSGMNFPAAE
jgi:tetratricopeptide (TPR) repeat protein